MNTTFKKELEFEIVGTLNELLSKHNKDIAGEMKKTIKSSSKILSRKFSKGLKKVEKKKAKVVKVAPKSKSRRRATSTRKK